ncbi:RES family NAD+ phosphorylase [Pseudomonas shirazensis]|uniref:RES family NAD+ phosphorylase n=1 Tax=Pseudomonas shirazensis TaxID=2745494 RepID=UPI003D2970CC
MQKDDRTAMTAEQYVCFKCATDPFLARQIRRNGQSVACCLCETKRKSISLANLVARVEKILEAYVCPGEHHFQWNDAHGSFQRQFGELIDVWVGEIFGCDNIHPVVQLVCRNLTNYSDDVNYAHLPFLPSDFRYQWGEFQEGLAHGNRFFNESAKSFLDWLFKDLAKYSASSNDHAVVRILSPEEAPAIYRARSCATSDDVTKIRADPARNLSAPPKEIAGEGRMNPAGVPAFYGAFERKTCVAELRPPVGGTVVSGKFKLTKSIKVLDFGRFESADLGPEPSFFEPKYFEKRGRREFLKYLHNLITVPVLPGTERNYLTSQAVAEYLATHCKPRIDGLIFKSVQAPMGNNIVLFSHVACAPTPTFWSVDGAMGVMGAKPSSGPCIEYVADSLVYHDVRYVAYETADEQLSEDKPKLKAEPVYEF